MAKKKEEVTTEEEVNVFETFTRNYIILDKTCRGIINPEPPEGMVKAMAKDIEEKPGFLAFLLRRLEAIWNTTPEEIKTEEVIAMRENVIKEAEELPIK